MAHNFRKKNTTITDAFYTMTQSTSKQHTPLVLVIMDGYANNPNPRGNAVFQAQRPNLQKLFQHSPTTELVTFGERVGLPDDQMGNSEVGHLNIGAGRVVEQELTRINRAVREGSLGTNPRLQALLNAAKVSSHGALHLIGLLSTGGVHSSLRHAQALVEEAARAGVPRVFVHAITDGRDRPPTASLEDLGSFEQFLTALRAQYPALDIRIASIIGRYYAMDRDCRWERTEKTYRLFTAGEGDRSASAVEAIKKQFADGKQDEFLSPCFLTAQGREATVQEHDTVVFFNFRADRMRQIVPCFADPSFSQFKTGFALTSDRIGTLTEYDDRFSVEVLFRPFAIENHLGTVIADAGLRQLRIAETEKYAHVTYFFNGGDETVLPGEERMLVPSPRDVATYDLKPEMSAYGVLEKLLESLSQGQNHVSIVNFANCDMVGHTGNFDAAVKAVETVDTCIGSLLSKLEELGGCAIITADHGNADQMIDYETGGPHTFHTKYPVPFSIFGAPNIRLRSDGSLCDIAPTVCHLLGLTPPPQMTGRTLLLPL